MTSTSGAGDGAPGKEGSPASDANVGGAEAEDSGYRRDDYWREEAREDVTPGTEPEPDDGFAFEDTADRVESESGGASAVGKDEGRAEEAREQGNSGGRDDANIVEKG